MEGMAASQTDRSRASALVGPKSGLGARRTSRARPGSDSLGVFRGIAGKACCTGIQTYLIVRSVALRVASVPIDESHTRSGAIFPDHRTCAVRSEEHTSELQSLRHLV